MTDHDGPSDDVTQPVQLRKEARPTPTERIATPPPTQHFQQPSAPSTYSTPPGQYGSPPPSAPSAPPQFPPPQPVGPPPAYNTVVMTGRPGPSGAVVTIAWILAVVSFFYLLPWAIAATRNKSNQGGIFLINFFLGWSLIGWVIALVMACGTDPQSNVVIVNQSTSQHYYR